MSSSLSAATSQPAEGLWVGLRMTAEDFLCALHEGHDYELVDGVVVMSPSPKPEHQAIAVEVSSQIWLFLRDHPVGRVLVETDVYLGSGPDSGDLVYRPEVVFVRAARLPEIRGRITGAPDLVVEVASPDSRRFATETKKNDYQRFGVREYWLIDPQRRSFTVYRLDAGRFVEIPAAGDSFVSQAVPGFVLDLTRVRQAFSAW